MRLYASLFTLAVFVLAGCAGKDPQPAPSTPTAGPGHPATVLIPWTVRDCTFIMAVIPVEIAALERYLPEGFASVSVQAMNITPAPDPRGDAMIGIEAERCDSGDTVNNGTLTDFSISSFWTPIVPPATLEVSPYTNTTAQMYVYKWELGFDDEDRIRELVLQGVPVHKPVSTFNFPSEIVGTGPFTATLNVDDSLNYEYRGAGATDQYVANQYNDFVCHSFTPLALAGGVDPQSISDPHRLYARAETHFVASLIREYGGTLVVPENTLASDILGGPGPHQFYAFVGTGSYLDSTLYIPDNMGH